VFQEGSARWGHTRQASHSIASRQHDRGNPQCEYITPLGYALGSFQHAC
jgi:hypothetical protein